MKTIHSIFFASILCAPLCMQAQEFPKTLGGMCHGGTGSDRFYAICQMQDMPAGHMIYYAGSTNSTDGDIKNPKSTNGNSDYLVYSPNTLFSNGYYTFGGSGEDAAFGITGAFQTLIAVSGKTSSPDGDFGPTKGNEDVGILILRRELDPASSSIELLKKVWSRSYGGSGTEIGASMAFTADSGLVFAASTTSADFDVSNNYGSYDVWLVKLDKAGSIVWEKNFGGSAEDRGISLQKTKDGGFIIAGNTFSSDHDVTLNKGSSDVWIVKLDGAGNKQWQKTYGGTGYDKATKIEQTHDGGYIIGAITTSNDGDVSGNHGKDDAWVIKTDDAGNIQWQKTYGGSEEEIHITIKPNDFYNKKMGYFLAVSTRSTDGDVTDHYSSPSPNYDAWTALLDTTGNIIWAKSIGGSKDDYVFDAELPVYGVLDLAGGTTSSDGNIKNYHPNPSPGVSEDALSARLMHEVNSVKDVSAIGAKIYPTLTNGVVNIQFKELQANTRLTITDITGKPLHHATATEKLQQLDISNYPPGNYLLTITDGQGREVHRLTKM